MPSRALERSRTNGAGKDEQHLTLQKQRQAIDTMKEANEMLKQQLSLESRQSKITQKMASSSEISKLQDLGDVFTRKIELEKRKIEDLEKQLQELDESTAQYRNKLSEMKSSKEGAFNPQKQIKILENRLEKTLMKHNEGLAKNKMLRDQIDELRKERVVFDGIYKKLERELHEKKKQMAIVIDESNSACEARDNARQEILNLKQQADKEQKDFEQEWKQLGTQIDEDRRSKDVMKKIVAETGADEQEALNRSQNEEKKMKRKVAKGAWNAAKDKTKIALSKERVQSYEEAFMKIQKLTGISDMDTLVSKFVEAEDKNFSLFNYVNELNSDIERHEVMIADVKAEIERYKGQGMSSDNQRKKILRDLEDRLKRTEAKANEYEEKHAEGMKAINQLKVGIHSIFCRIGCQSSSLDEMLGNQGVTESNMMQYLGIIEQRTSEILQMCAANLQANGGDLSGFNLHGIGGDSNIQVPLGDSRSLVVEPPTWEDLESDEEFDIDQEERPLNREELARVTQKDIERKQQKTQMLMPQLQENSDAIH